MLFSLNCPFFLLFYQGFESEHHRRALAHLENVFFYEDHKAGRVGVLTTNPVKHAAMELVNIMLRERRICVCKHVHSRDKKALLVRLREQLQVYSHILLYFINRCTHMCIYFSRSIVFSSRLLSPLSSRIARRCQEKLE